MHVRTRVEDKLPVLDHGQAVKEVGINFQAVLNDSEKV